MTLIFGKHINKYYIKHAPALLLGIFALVLVDYFQLKIPELYRIVINGMNGAKVKIDGAEYDFTIDLLLDKVCLPIIVIIVIMVIGRFLWRVCFFGSAISVETDLRTKMFDHSRKLSCEYYQKNKVGSLMSLYTNDLETIQECFGDGILMFFDALLLGTLAFAKMWRMNVFLTCLSMIPMILMFTIGNIVGRSMTKKWEIRQQAFSDLSDFSQESFSGIAVIKAFVKETKELAAFKKLNVENEKTNVDYTKTSVLLNILISLTVELVICIIIGYGGYTVTKGGLDAGQLIEYISYFSSIVWPVMAIAMLIEKSSRGKASLARIGELLDAGVDVKDGEGAADIKDVKGNIEFRNLSFRYPDGEFDVLTDVSFKINAGEFVGIVGKTGSGKTTIVDLILRTYNVKDGCLFIDGHDVNSLTISSVRAGCAYVPQDNFLFSDTIANNISFAKDESDIEEVEKYARLADIHENIAEFAGGYDTVLGERGVTVSGGQKQRISIARALLKNAPILILDDSVSAVDTKTEKIILENLAQSRAGKTTILIAHRISTVEDADKIIFVDDGRVAAVGTHRSLYESCAEYRKAVDLQKLEHESGESGGDMHE